MSGCRRLPGFVLAVGAAFGPCGCSDVQSALSPLGPEAERIHLLSWILFAGSGVIFLAVLALTGLALLGPPRSRGWLARETVIIGGGIVFPVVTLTALLIFGLVIMRAGGAEPGQGEALRIAVVGEQWWWRITYTAADGSQVETANELRIPAGRPVELELTTADVIHSFWVPNLAGKVDMIPGRTNRLRLVAHGPGESRGQCAEYCGGAHALMSFHVVALAEPDFAVWFDGLAAPAREPVTAEARRGRELFLQAGCGACHTVRGTAARGTIGPDLTHLGGRLALAAATLPNEAAALVRWIRDNQHIKPENRMPPYGIFSDAELLAIAAYLRELE